MLSRKKKEKHIAAQHSTAQHNAEENKNENMSQGRAEKHLKRDISSYLILGLI